MEHGPCPRSAAGWVGFDVAGVTMSRWFRCVMGRLPRVTGAGAQDAGCRMRAHMGDDRRSASCGERCSRDGSWSGSTDVVDDERPGDDGRWPMTDQV
jgi:hypothetical protein